MKIISSTFREKISISHEAQAKALLTETHFLRYNTYS